MLGGSSSINTDATVLAIAERAIAIIGGHR
jgi:hypothetical protein